MKTKMQECPRCGYSKAYFARDFKDGKGKPATDLVCADCGFSFQASTKTTQLWHGKRETVVNAASLKQGDEIVWLGKVRIVRRVKAIGSSANVIFKTGFSTLCHSVVKLEEVK